MKLIAQCFEMSDLLTTSAPSCVASLLHEALS